MPRKKLIAANWKMFKTAAQTRDFFRDFLPLVQDHSRDEIVVCPPFVDIPAAVESARGSNVSVGGQNMYWEKEGAFTGEISAGMLVALGVTHVIIGHSERRQYFGETDDTVNLKLKAALEGGLTPIVCVGEVLEEREANLTDDVLRRQCLRAFHAIWQEGWEFNKLLRTGLGHRYREDSYSPDGRGRTCDYSWRGSQGLWRRVRRRVAHSLWRFGEARQCQIADVRKRD